MDEVIRRATPGPCILDGELIVWHKKRCAAGRRSVPPIRTD